MAVRGFGLFVALGLSLSSLAGILLAILGGINNDSYVLRNLFPFQIDLTTFFANEPEGAHRGAIPGITNNSVGDIPGMTSETQAFASALWHARGADVLSQFYNVYLWDYCTSDTSVVASSAVCSPHSSHDKFDPFTAMDLSRWTGSQPEDSVYPEKLASGMRVYRAAVNWLRASLILAAIAKFIELVLAVVAVGASVFILLVTITQTAIWSFVVAAWHNSLSSIGVDAHLGKGFVIILWLATILSFSSSIWWLFTLVCANHRSGPGRRRWMPNVRATQSYRYDNMGNTSQPQHDFPMSTDVNFAHTPVHSRSPSEAAEEQLIGNSYENYRHQAAISEDKV
ncbi:SUR7/PalI family-domain-containing protein [Talaromyces proteolyticus]|uniref:SUR7/PalI family-domain-containing protein n=1 Tax=Talaromyces proteolyticus TaxID=1131652 RepID=A0AAD4KHZ3_9EURO|nr:SUR7/PalI family-domain-containing protein [Talaromyces proteolyticus]KAH8688840.1 SUR7/PalI family-domain-containing protein [Talaromyces proteolyticus]